MWTYSDALLKLRSYNTERRVLQTQRLDLTLVLRISDCLCSRWPLCKVLSLCEAGTLRLCWRLVWVLQLPRQRVDSWPWPFSPPTGAIRVAREVQIYIIELSILGNNMSVWCSQFKTNHDTLAGIYLRNKILASQISEPSIELYNVQQA